MADQDIQDEIERIGTLLGIELSLNFAQEVVIDRGPWTLEISMDKDWKSSFVALDHVSTAEVFAYLKALDMVGHRAVVTFQDVTDEATVNEILEFEADNPTEFEPNEIDAALQDPKNRRK